MHRSEFGTGIMDSNFEYSASVVCALVDVSDLPPEVQRKIDEFLRADSPESFYRAGDNLIMSLTPGDEKIRALVHLVLHTMILSCKLSATTR